MSRHQNYNEDWKNETLLKFPKIESYLKSNNQHEHKMRGNLLKDIRIKEEKEFQERVKAIDAKMNVNVILKYDTKYKSLIRNRKPISTFLAPNIVHRIVHNVNLNKHFPLHDYSKDNFGQKSLLWFPDAKHSCDRFKRLEKSFDDYRYKQAFDAIDREVKRMQEEALEKQREAEAEAARAAEEAARVPEKPTEKADKTWAGKGHFKVSFFALNVYVFVNLYFFKEIEASLALNEEESGGQVQEENKPKPKSRLTPIEDEEVEDPTELLADLKTAEEMFQRQLTRENSLLKPKKAEIQSDYVKNREQSNASNADSVKSIKLVGYDD